MSKGVHAKINVSSWSLILAFVYLVMAGCGGTQQKRIYQANPPSKDRQPMSVKIAVVELEDHSPGTGFINWNMFEGFTPGYLYWTEYEKYHNTLFGKCLAAELKESELFEVVDYHSNWEKLAEGFPSYDLIVTGRLHQDRFEHTQYTYVLLDPLGAVLWLVGFPAFGSSRQANFELTAFKPLQPDLSIWTHPIKFEDSRVEGFYYGHGISDLGSMRALVKGHNFSDTDFCPTELLRPAFLSMRNSLTSALGKNFSTQSSTILSEENSSERQKP